MCVRCVLVMSVVPMSVVPMGVVVARVVVVPIAVDCRHEVAHEEPVDSAVVGRVECIHESFLEPKAVGHEEVCIIDHLDVLGGWLEVVRVLSIRDDDRHVGCISDEFGHDRAKHRIGDDDGGARRAWRGVWGARR